MEENEDHLPQRRGGALGEMIWYKRTWIYSPHAERGDYKLLSLNNH